MEGKPEFIHCGVTPLKKSTNSSEAMLEYAWVKGYTGRMETIGICTGPM
jgi:hypothetical protein